MNSLWNYLWADPVGAVTDILKILGLLALLGFAVAAMSRWLVAAALTTLRMAVELAVQLLRALPRSIKRRIKAWAAAQWASLTKSIKSIYRRKGQ